MHRVINVARETPLGNGSLLINFDLQGRIRDIYFPEVGGNNHTKGHLCRFGVWVDEVFTWFPDDGWSDLSIRYIQDTLVTRVTARHEELGVSLTLSDTVDFNNPFLIRAVQVDDEQGRSRSVRLFFHHDLRINENESKDTVHYDPATGAVVHYKDNRYFLFGGHAPPNAPGLSGYCAGTKEKGGAEGTWRDAEDGVLSGHPIEQGSVDSTICLHTQTGRTAYTWLAAGASYPAVAGLHAKIIARGPRALIERNEAYWRFWVNRDDQVSGDLPKPVVALYKRSLLITRTQVDEQGGIVASTDWENAPAWRDTYGYVWPRDGALIAAALDLAGMNRVAEDFFRFCEKVITEGGYLLHKYNPDGSPASSWHPWIADGKPQLPIQEDETALVLWALWRHFSVHKDVELIRHLYRRLIVPAGEFMYAYRDQRTGLPLPSWDLWEERYGIHTFTTAATCTGLSAAARFAAAFGEKERSNRFAQAAEEMRRAMDGLLWRPEIGRFCRTLRTEASDDIAEQLSQVIDSIFHGGKRPDGVLELPRHTADPNPNASPSDLGFHVDPTVDASLAGTFLFGAYAPGDPQVTATMIAVRELLLVDEGVGGVARYQGDNYFRPQEAGGEIPGNPWIVCTLWLAEWEMLTADSFNALAATRRYFDWTLRWTTSSGILPEQLHPYTGAPLSVMPLTWSHAAVIAAVQRYARRYRRLVGRPAEWEVAAAGSSGTSS